MEIEGIDSNINSIMRSKSLQIYSIFNEEYNINHIVTGFSKIKDSIIFIIIGVNNPFKSLQKVQSELHVYFNIDGSLISYSIIYYLHMDQNRFNTGCNFHYDENNQLVNIHYFRVDYSVLSSDLFYKKSNEELHYLDDIEALVNLFFKRENNTILKDILPEYYIDGVYDFNSTEFKKRLELAMMYIY